jgi:hypothetical protein
MTVRFTNCDDFPLNFAEYGDLSARMDSGTDVDVSPGQGWTREVMMTTGITQQRSLNASGASNRTTTSGRARLARWATPGTAALIGAIAVTTVACGSQTPAQPIAGANGVTAAQWQQPTLNAMGQPVTPNALQANGQAPNGNVLVNCGPGQQAMIRPVLMNGQAVSQVECVAMAATVPQQVAYAQPGYASPYAQQVAYPQAVAPVAAPTPTYVSYEPTPAPRVVRAPSNVRRASYRTSGDYVEYRKPSRDWKKSAIIIGSTAGIGAGVGAATGGKKGALIGAAIGGGGAAIWDQVTRRKE